MELGSHSESDCLLLHVSTADPSDFVFCDCSAQLLKEQTAECKSCFSLTGSPHIVQELCESRGGRPGLSVLTSLLVSVDVNIY